MPLEIYNKNDQWISIKLKAGGILLFHDNHNGIMDIIGITTRQDTGYYNLPNGVFGVGGNQTGVGGYGNVIFENENRIYIGGYNTFLRGSFKIKYNN